MTPQTAETVMAIARLLREQADYPGVEWAAMDDEGWRGTGKSPTEAMAHLHVVHPAPERIRRVRYEARKGNDYGISYDNPHDAYVYLTGVMK